MRKFSNEDLRLFEQICKLRQAGLWKTMYEYLKMQYPKVVRTKDYIYAEGTIPIVLLAHLDTVFPNPPSEIYYDERKGVLWSPDGLGADDRAGVFAILKILAKGYRPHIIFTTEEESGGIGAAQLALKEPTCPFEKVKYMIQLDRRGKNDCVFYDCDNKNFVLYVESFGFIEEIGSFSDISTLCPVWKIAGVNLSIGYEDEHSVVETLHINPFLSTIQKVTKMLDAAESAPFFEFIPGIWYRKFNWISKGDAPIESFLVDEEVCSGCGGTFSEYEVIPVEQKDFRLKYYCPDCLGKATIDWCDYCGEAYTPQSKNDHLCFTCREDIYAKYRGLEKYGKNKGTSKKGS